MIIPPFLQPGDTIAIVCPAGFMAREKAQTCIDTLIQWGYRVRIGPTLNSDSTNYFSGTDDERLADLQLALDDANIKAVLCGRGGYGLSRIIDSIDFSRFRERPKWIIGFSDITVLHAHLFTVYDTASLHAPMAGAFNDGGDIGEGVLSLHRMLMGEKAAYESPTHPFNRHGRATAPLVGGNLTLLAHLTGTRTALDTRGKLLFLEDVGEYLYNIDRMLLQLKRSGQLAHLAGLIVGGFTDDKDTTRPFGATVEEIIRDKISDYDYPVCFGFPVSHGKDNVALKIGLPHTLIVSDEPTILIE
jgi:muramoyltetrapeptide carboxypeptidase